MNALRDMMRKGSQTLDYLIETYVDTVNGVDLLAQTRDLDAGALKQRYEELEIVMAENAARYESDFSPTKPHYQNVTGSLLQSASTALDLVGMGLGEMRERTYLDIARRSIGTLTAYLLLVDGNEAYARREIGTSEGFFPDIAKASTPSAAVAYQNLYVQESLMRLALGKSSGDHAASYVSQTA